MTPCRGETDLFFASDRFSLAKAKSLCAGCPAAATCLEGALDRREAAGVWGGVQFPEEARRLLAGRRSTQESAA